MVGNTFYTDEQIKQQLRQWLTYKQRVVQKIMRLYVISKLGNIHYSLQ